MRALRRHHRARLFRKRLQQESMWTRRWGAETDENWREQQYWAAQRAKVRVETGCRCSCFWCSRGPDDRKRKLLAKWHHQQMEEAA